MKENDLIELLHKVLNVPKLAFGANTVEPYKELQYITEKADYILYLQNMYLINKNNLKIYKDDAQRDYNLWKTIMPTHSRGSNSLFVDENSLKPYFNSEDKKEEISIYQLRRRQKSAN